MLISVIIPIYNCINTLRDTVTSIIKSGMTSYEIILVDDGSTDGSSRVCDKLEQHYSEIKCVHQKNLGVSAARNHGLSISKGKYILFVDADDTVVEDSMEKLILILQTNKPDMLIFGFSFDYYHHGKLYRRDDMTYKHSGIITESRIGDYFVELFEYNALSPVWNKFIKRKTIEESGILFNTHMVEMEDFLFSVECLKKCSNIYISSNVVYRYKQAENEMSTFKRLLTIDSLTKYMDSLEHALDKSVDGGGSDCISKEEIRTVNEKIYVNMFLELIRYGDIFTIRKCSQDMMTSKYSSVIKREKRKLYFQISKKHYLDIWIRSRLRRMRHSFAVKYKFFKSKRSR